LNCLVSRHSFPHPALPESAHTQGETARSDKPNFLSRMNARRALNHTRVLASACPSGASTAFQWSAALQIRKVQSSFWKESGGRCDGTRASECAPCLTTQPNSPSDRFATIIGAEAEGSELRPTDVGGAKVIIASASLNAVSGSSTRGTVDAQTTVAINKRPIIQ
jgi:hypothetical protein